MRGSAQAGPRRYGLGISGQNEAMADRHEEYEPLSDEELEAQHGEEIPEREAMSVLGLPVAGPGGGIPIEPPVSDA